MAKKIMAWKTKGMNKDLSVSAFNPEFAFENMNLRLSTNEGNTQMSWVTEKGTGSVHFMVAGTGESTFLTGTPIGCAVIEHTIVLFIHSEGELPDRIYRLYPKEDDSQYLLVEKLFEGNLGFSTDYPLETLVSYESKLAQKVYWTDGINQPRVINVVGKMRKDSHDSYVNTQFDFIPTLQLKETVTVEKKLDATGMFAPGVIQYAFTYYNKYGQESNIFHTTPLCYISYKDRGASPEDKVGNAFRITVEDVDTNFDYLRIYSIQRTSINGTPICKRIQDISLADLYIPTGTRQYVVSTPVPQVLVNDTWMDFSAVPSSMVHLGRTLNVLGRTLYCMGFDYGTFSGMKVRTGIGTLAWSGQASTQTGHVIWISTTRTSVDNITGYLVFEAVGQGIVDVTSFEDMGFYADNSLTTVHYTDTGTSGESIDPMELLYKGGEEITAGTMNQKDGTLFLGNISVKRPSIETVFKDAIRNAVSIDKTQLRTVIPTTISTGNYVYRNQLTAFADSARTESVPCGGFKYGDYYRLGLQFQYRTGKWSDPVWIGDEQVTTVPNEQTNGNIQLPMFIGRLDSGVAGQLVSLGYMKTRPIVVFPSMQDRVSVCQGVVNTTLFTKDRDDNGIGAQSDWFFRPPKVSQFPSIGSDGSVRPVGLSNYGNQGFIPYLPYTDKDETFNPQYIKGVEVQGDYENDSKFAVNGTILTFHSPEVEFNDELAVTNFDGMKYKVTGRSTIQKTFSDIDIQTETPTISNSGAGFVHKSFVKDNMYGIVSGLFYDDFPVDDSDATPDARLQKYDRVKSSYKWMVYLWNKGGSLNNDINRPADKGVATALLKKKVISNLRFASTTLNPNGTDGYFNGNPQLFSSNEVSVLKLGDRIYQGNIDTLLQPDHADGQYFAFSGNSFDEEKDTPFTHPNVWWKTFSTNEEQSVDSGIWKYNGTKWEGHNGAISDAYVDLVMKKEGVRMKYKSTPHLAFRIASVSDIEWSDYADNSSLPVVDIVRISVDEDRLFGGRSADAFRENVWLPCGKPVRLDNIINGSVEVCFEYGDTYFQRYDHLKTYAFTPEDINQVVEIGSFMLETHVNIDGRYDRNRGQVSNLNMSPRNFNLMNPVYSQQDNFFTYRIQDDDFYRSDTYPNQITWSRTKQSGADIDLWNNVTLASTLELDGDKGRITSIQRLNDQLICFQDQGISQILYNENVQVSTEKGVPIEIANSGKVQGKRYFSDTIGCSNKWSICCTPAGIYFMDSIGKGIHLFNGQLANLSTSLGFNSWAKAHIPGQDARWDPVGFNNFRAHYDARNQEVLFANRETALAYSEKFGVFTSFYDYGRTAYLASLDGLGLWFMASSDNLLRVWRHQEGEYCRFFGVNRPYWMTLVGNPEPQLDKTFTNLEFRACTDMRNMGDINLLPFDLIEAWDEYQHGYALLGIRNGRQAFQHHRSDGTATLKRKFRMWRCDIPRNNCLLDADRVGNEPYSTDEELGISRFIRKPMDRMRNPWVYLRLYKAEAGSREALLRTEVHDAVMTYFT